jgi:membrane protease YdiL (CAAX protease family)
MSPTDGSGFDKVRVRYIAIVWLLLRFYTPLISFLPLGYLGPMTWYWWDLVYIFYGHAFFALTLFIVCRLDAKVRFRRIFGRPATRSEYRAGFEMTAFLLVLSIAAEYASLFPLSYWVPEIIEWWYINLADLIIFDLGTYPFFANAFSLLSLCVFGPVLEEFAFRGVILHRWARVYSLKSAVLGSSVLFAVIHPDPLGAFFFGIGMSILYLKTQSLILPIVCHGMYNLVVWFIELGYLINLGPEYIYTLQQFQDEWPVGVICAIAALVWIVLYLRRPKDEIPWKLPVT